MSELLNCSNCQAGACRDERLEYCPNCELGYWVYCSKCLMQTPCCDTQEEADAIWNTRDSPWSPFTDAPEDGTEILVLTKSSDIEKVKCMGEMWVQACDDSIWVNHNYFTHYMLLSDVPKPPEENK